MKFKCNYKNDISQHLVSFQHLIVPLIKIVQNIKKCKKEH